MPPRVVGYGPKVWRFEPRDCDYLQQTTPIILDVIIGHAFIDVQKVLSFGFLLLESWDGKYGNTIVQSCASCFFSHVDGQVHPFLVSFKYVCDARYVVSHKL